MRLTKFIAHSGYCSRRMAEKLVRAGLVKINEVIIQDLSLQVGPHDIIKVEDRILTPPANPKLWLYYKPKGLITTHYDPQGRETVFSAVYRALKNLYATRTPDSSSKESFITCPQHLISVGRLDLNSEGLLLITNNGDLARRLELPGLPRKYRCRIYGELTEQQISEAAKGLTIDKITYRKIKITKILSKSKVSPGIDKKNTWVNITLYEGKNRKIRRIMSYFNLGVSRLIRVAYGEFKLGNLKPNDIIEADQSLIKSYLT